MGKECHLQPSSKHPLIPKYHRFNKVLSKIIQGNTKNRNF